MVRQQRNIVRPVISMIIIMAFTLCSPVMLADAGNMESLQDKPLVPMLAQKTMPPVKKEESAEEKDEKNQEAKNATHEDTAPESKENKVEEKQVETITRMSKPEVVEAEVVTIAETPTVPVWDGPVLNRTNGTVQGPSGKETYYNLPMSEVVRIMRDDYGIDYEYWVRDDGVKMYGDYVMCAASLDIRPKGTIVETSLGTGIVVDTGGFAKSNKYQLDIAVSW